jgi:diacylglycerol diphosphate phosphatase/phosphatidate phosphatase
MVNCGFNDHFDRILAINIATCVIVFVVFTFLALLPVQSNFALAERDPSHSFPLVQEQIPTATLIVICFASPVFLILYFYLVTVFSKKSYESKPTKLFSYFLTTTYLSLSVTILATHILKILISEPRPNFFHMCNYQYARDNSTYYFLHTRVGDLVNYSNCKGDYYETQNARSSFPSGHSSTAFSIALSLVYCLQYSEVTAPWCFIPLLCAAFIAVTRVMDYYHSILDVTCGTLLGLIISTLIWGPMHQHIHRLNKVSVEKDEGRSLFIV